MSNLSVGENVLIFPCENFEIKLEYREGLTTDRKVEKIAPGKWRIPGIGPWAALVRRNEDESWVIQGAGDTPEVAIEMAKKNGRELFRGLEMIEFFRSMGDSLTQEERKQIRSQYLRQW